MKKLDEIAHDHNARIDSFRGLNVAHVPVRSNRKTDIEFSEKERRSLDRVFPLLAGRKIKTGLYARGKDVDSWVELFASDDELCTALLVLLGNYAYSIEWAGSRLSARVSAHHGSIDGDATGGERFFANLDVAAARLSVLSDRGSLRGQSLAKMAWGPAALRKFVLATAFFVTFALLIVSHYLIAQWH